MFPVRVRDGTKVVLIDPLMRCFVFSAAFFFLAVHARAACVPAQEFGCVPLDLFRADGTDARLRYAPEFRSQVTGSWRAGLDLHASWNALRIAPNNPSTVDTVDALVSERLEGALRGSVALNPAWSLHLSAPLILAQSGRGGTGTAGSRDAHAARALGDVRVGASYNHQFSGDWSLASRLHLALPTATEGAFAGARSFSVLSDIALQRLTGNLAVYASVRSRFETATRAPYDAPTSWLGLAMGANLALVGDAFAVHAEALGYASLNQVASYAQDRTGAPRLDLVAQTWTPALLSLGASSSGLVCRTCTLHASAGASPGAVASPALSALLRLEYRSQPQAVTTP